MQSVPDRDAGGREGLVTIPTFRLKNIIDIPALDVDIHPKLSLTWHPRYDILVFDPGQMVGWAGLASLGVYKDSRRAGTTTHIEVGQGEWHECMNWNAQRVFIETTPYAARRTFDPWPIRFDGAVRAKIHPTEPESCFPTNLHVSKEWFSLPRGHGLGRHAKDALTHLVAVLVREASA